MQKSIGELDPEEYDCPKCHNKGFIAVPRKGYFPATASCECVEIRKNLRHIRESGMKQLLDRHNFENFAVTEPWQERMFRGAQAYGEKPEGWILFSGQSGAGKTHLCSAICGVLAAKKLQFRYMPWREEITALKALATDLDRREEKMVPLRTTPYLFIDDLFKGGADAGVQDVSLAEVRFAFELLNCRSNNHLPTIISTELYPGELKKLNEALFGRIMERCGKHVYAIKRAPGRNYRLKAAT